MKKHIQFYFIGLLALLSFTASPLVQAANIQVTVSKTKVVKNEVFQLKVIVDEKVSSDAIDFSPLEQDFYLGRPSFGTSVNIINGDYSSRSEWNVSLAAQHIGIIKIPAFTVEGATSQPIAIQVTVDSNEPQIDDLIELQNSLDKRELYPNESAQLKTRLVIKTDPRRLQNPKVIPPQANGLTLTALGEARQYQSVLNGMEVTVVEQNYRVTADQAGDYSLSGIGFSGSVVYGSNRSGSTRLVDASTPAEQFDINVHPIPDSYQGSWLPASDLSLTQRWLDADGQAITSTTHPTKVGESLTREITLEIQGLTAERFPNIVVNYPDSLRVYQEKPQFDTLTNGATRMTLTQVLIPQQQGEIALNDVSINWWNSSRKQQQNAMVQGLTLSVAEGDTINLGEASVGNVTPAPTETVVVKDAGIWPYLTALFAVLWLVTAALWVMALRRKPAAVQSSESTPSLSPSSNKDHLVNALKREDFVHTSYYSKEWLKEVACQKQDLVDAFHMELEAMNRHQYSESSDKWNNQKMLTLIRDIEKHAHRASAPSATLPDL